jgi:membrane protease YdiL (CAAX protease family)
MDEISTMRRWWLWTECLVVFFGLPTLLVVARSTFGRLVIPTLLVLAVGCLVLLLRDPTFDRRRLVGTRNLGAGVRRILAVFLPAGAVVGLAVWFFLPERFLAFPAQRPQLWLMVMLLYPLVSVYPQELLFRTFFFHRYRPLFGDRWAMITMSALAFGAAHLFFANPVAPIMSAIGGGLFAWTYARSGSTLQSVIEHALWGDLIFTIGLGWYFYGGAIGR